jgi:hypothetical protein
MQIALRYLSALVGLFFLALGLMFLFSPGGQTTRFALLASGNTGLSPVKNAACTSGSNRG